MTVTLTPDALSLASVLIALGGLGFAAFSLAERVGRMSGSEWWEEKLHQKHGLKH